MTDQPDFIQSELKTIGQRIRQIRKAKGFTNHEQFAYTHEFNRSSYYRHERGEDFRMSSFIKILRAFEMDYAEFFAEGFEKVEGKKGKKK